MKIFQKTIWDVKNCCLWKGYSKRTRCGYWGILVFLRFWKYIFFYYSLFFLALPLKLFWSSFWFARLMFIRNLYSLLKWFAFNMLQQKHNHVLMRSTTYIYWRPPDQCKFVFDLQRDFLNNKIYLNRNSINFWLLNVLLRVQYSDYWIEKEIWIFPSAQRSLNILNFLYFLFLQDLLACLSPSDVQQMLDELASDPDDKHVPASVR